MVHEMLTIYRNYEKMYATLSEIAAVMCSEKGILYSQNCISDFKFMPEVGLTVLQYPCNITFYSVDDSFDCFKVLIIFFNESQKADGFSNKDGY